MAPCLTDQWTAGTLLIRNGDSSRNALETVFGLLWAGRGHHDVMSVRQRERERESARET